MLNKIILAVITWALVIWIVSIFQAKGMIVLICIFLIYGIVAEFLENKLN